MVLRACPPDGRGQVAADSEKANVQSMQLKLKFDAPMPVTVMPKSKVKIEVESTVQAVRRVSQWSLAPS